MMFEIILSLKIKNFHSRDQNNFFMITFLIVGFDLIEDHNSYLCLVLFSFRIDSIRNTLCFESEDIIW